MKDSKLTVVGLVDPVDVVAKLRKVGAAAIVSVGPAKEEKKDGDKKDGDKKDGDKKDGDKKTPPPVILYPHHQWYPYAAAQYHPHPYPPQYVVHSAEEDPNSCVIC
jgi:hypothetical protein